MSDRKMYCTALVLLEKDIYYINREKWRDRDRKRGERAKEKRKERYKDT